MLYKNIEDFQKVNWYLNHVANIEEWRELALSWADSDEFNGVAKTLKTLPENEVIDYIADFWQLDIVPVKCWHENCNNNAAYELETCDGKIIHVCESCDEMWDTCDECDKCDIVGEGMNVCGDIHLCNECFDKRQKIIVERAAELYAKEVEPDGPEGVRIEDYTVHDAITQAMYDLEWDGLPKSGNYDFLIIRQKERC